MVVHTERTVYKVKEPVIIVIENEGNEKVAFGDSEPNIEIRNKDTGKSYDVTTTQIKTELEPGESITITWDQTDGVESGEYIAVLVSADGTEVGETTFTIET